MQVQSISAASLAYAEVLIAEIALRNRERIMLVLPLLLQHYRRVFLLFCFAALAAYWKFLVVLKPEKYFRGWKKNRSSGG